MKFTDEELSRILGESAAGHLRRGGAFNWHKRGETACCVNQAAYNESSAGVAYTLNTLAAFAFDTASVDIDDPEKLLDLLKGIGCA